MMVGARGGVYFQVAQLSDVHLCYRTDFLVRMYNGIFLLLSHFRACLLAGALLLTIIGCMNASSVAAIIFQMSISFMLRTTEGQSHLEFRFLVV